MIRYSCLVFSFIFALAIGQVDAQVKGQQTAGQEQNTRTWSFSLKASGNISGINHQMESSMVESGFGDTHKSILYFFGFHSTTYNDYPIKSSSIIPWDMEVRRVLSAHHSIAATFGNAYHATITGYNRMGDSDGHFLELDTKIQQFSVNYIFTLPDSYTGFRIGPIMAFHRVRENGSTGSEQTKTSIKPGLNLGFDAALFEKKSWFMAFSIGGSLFPSATVGPYTKEVSYYQNGDLETITSTYHPAKIQLSSMKIGLTIGWRLF